MDSRFVGGNGSGKSTLFRMIIGEQTPDAGTVTVGETVVPMYVDQSRDLLSGDKTVIEDIAEGAEFIDLNGREVNTRQYCSWYNFSGTDHNKKVRDSGIVLSPVSCRDAFQNRLAALCSRVLVAVLLLSKLIEVYLGYYYPVRNFLLNRKLLIFGLTLLIYRLQQNHRLVSVD